MAERLRQLNPDLANKQHAGGAPAVAAVGPSPGAPPPQQQPQPAANQNHTQARPFEAHMLTANRGLCLGVCSGRGTCSMTLL